MHYLSKRGQEELKISGPDQETLKIYHESRKRRIFVGELTYNRLENRYELIYDKNYANSKNAIPISPDLDLFKLHHHSETGKLFPAFLDRIPDKSNPAYKDYCKAQGISPDESNPIILLGAIGKRGPSSFIFESIYYSKITLFHVVQLREQLGISQNDLANAFDVSKTTLQRLEAGISRDFNTLKLFQIMLSFPEVALWQLKLSGDKVHKDVLNKLIKYFEAQLNLNNKK